MIKLQKRNIVLLPAVFLAVFVFYLGYKKVESIKNQSENSATEMQSKINEQQTKINELQEESNNKQQEVDKYKAEISEQSITATDLNNKEAEQKLQVDKKEACNNAHLLYISMPSKSDNASRMGPASNIVELYKLEMKFKKEERVKNDLLVVEPAYQKYLEAKKLCPEFKEF
jgi:TolA-binding protein